MPRRRCTAACLALAACGPDVLDPPRASYDAVFVSSELTDLVALPDGEAIVVGHGRSDEGTWIAHAQRGYTPYMRNRPGRRIVATRTDDGEVFAMIHGMHSPPLGPEPPLLEHVHTEPGASDQVALDPIIDDIDEIQPTPRGDFLLTAPRHGIFVVTTDGVLDRQWPDAEVLAAAPFDDAILAARAAPTLESAAPISIEWLTHDGRPLESAYVDIPGRAWLSAIVGAGDHAFAIAMRHDFPGAPHSSVGVLGRDGSWRELAASDGPTDVQWIRALAVGPDGELVAAGVDAHADTVELRAWSSDAAPLWRLEFVRPAASGSPTYNDVCGGDGGLRVAVASDGGIAVGGHDNCSYSWMRMFEP